MKMDLVGKDDLQDNFSWEGHLSQLGHFHPLSYIFKQIS